MATDEQQGDRSRPRHLWADHGSQFEDAGVASAYRRRPPYPAETMRVVVDLLASSDAKVLELGAGSGDLTAPLADRVSSVTAVEPSAAMRSLGERRTQLARGRVAWSARSAETFVPDRTRC